MDATALQQESWEMSCVRAEAARYCNRHEITDSDTYLRVVASMAHRKFLEAIRPWQELRGQILNVHMPQKIIQHKDGRMEVVPEPLSALQTVSLLRLDDAIANEAKKWGFKTVAIESDSKVSEIDSNAMQMIALEPI